ncbi:MAG: hypothetical protein ACYTGN_08160 [Planctomycetota bacterium]
MSRLIHALSTLGALLCACSATHRPDGKPLGRSQTYIHKQFAKLEPTGITVQATEAKAAAFAEACTRFALRYLSEKGYETGPDATLAIRIRQFEAHSPGHYSAWGQGLLTRRSGEILVDCTFTRVTLSASDPEGAAQQLAKWITDRIPAPAAKPG